MAGEMIEPQLQRSFFVWSICVGYFLRSSTLVSTKNSDIPQHQGEHLRKLWRLINFYIIASP